jgi:elongation factor G
VPIICGSSYKNKGVQPMLDAVIYYLPSPVDVPAVVGTNPDTGESVTRAPSPDEPFSASGVQDRLRQVRHADVLPRVLGPPAEGFIRPEPGKGKRERVSRILRMHANKRDDVDFVEAGEIAAAVGLSNTVTGDTMCEEANPILLEAINFAEPVIFQSIEPKTKNDEDKMTNALVKLGAEDPTFKVRNDPETGQTIIGGMGELHLEIMVDRMKREFAVEANIGKPQVAYRETITKPAMNVEYKHIKQTADRASSRTSSSTSCRWSTRRRRARRKRRSPSSSSPKWSAVLSRASSGRRSKMVPRRRWRAAFWQGYPLQNVRVELTHRLVPRGRLERDDV